MRKKIVVAAAALLLAAAPLFAAVDAFMQIQGIDGGSKRQGHEGWIQLLGADLGAESSGHVVSHKFSVTKVFDSASCPLFEAAHTQRLYGTVLIDIGADRHTLTNVRILSFQDSGGGSGQAMARETVELTFTNDTVASTHGQTHPGVQKAASPASITANAILSGAGGAPAAIVLHSVRLTGPNTASIIVCDAAAGMGMTGLQRAFLARQRLPSLSLTASSGQQFTFSNATITGNAPIGGGCNQMSLSFTRYAGQPTYDWQK